MKPNDKAVLMQLKMHELIKVNDKCMPYNNSGIGVMNIQFDLLWEEIYGYLPHGC